MANVLISVVTVDTDLPAGVLPGALRISLTQTDGTVVSSQDVAGVEATFADVVPGTYVAVAQALDSQAQSLGAQVVQTFVVPTPPPTTFAQPQTITVTLS